MTRPVAALAAALGLSSAAYAGELTAATLSAPAGYGLRCAATNVGTKLDTFEIVAIEPAR